LLAAPGRFSTIRIAEALRRRTSFQTIMKPKLPLGLRCIVVSNDYYVMREDQKIGRIQRLTSTARETWLWNVGITCWKTCGGWSFPEPGEAIRAIIDALSDASLAPEK